MGIIVTAQVMKHSMLHCEIWLSKVYLARLEGLSRNEVRLGKRLESLGRAKVRLGKSFEGLGSASRVVTELPIGKSSSEKIASRQTR